MKRPDKDFGIKSFYFCLNFLGQARVKFLAPSFIYSLLSQLVGNLVVILTCTKLKFRFKKEKTWIKNKN